MGAFRSWRGYWRVSRRSYSCAGLRASVWPSLLDAIAGEDFECAITDALHQRFQFGAELDAVAASVPLFCDGHSENARK